MIIGRGEIAAAKILSEIYEVPLRGEFNGLRADGIYTQVPLIDLIKSDSYSNIVSGSSVDILVCCIGHNIAVYVNGKEHGDGNRGQLKSKRDEIRYKLLQENGWSVLVLPWNECPVLFRDVVCEDSRKEVEGMVASYGLAPHCR